MAFFIHYGLVGIDYGEHWDESYLQLITTNSVKQYSILPTGYIYGSFYPAMGFVTIAPKITPDIRSVLNEIKLHPMKHFNPSVLPQTTQYNDALVRYINSDPFLRDVRKKYIFFASLIILWAYLIGKQIDPRKERHWRELSGVICAGLMAFSWEYNYHARFIAVDAAYACFMVLIILMILYALHSSDPAKKRKWLYLAAGLVGAATTTKFTAITFIFPMLMTAILGRWGRPLKEILAVSIRMASSFVTMMVLLNPAACGSNQVYQHVVLWFHNYTVHQEHHPLAVYSNSEHILRTLHYLFTTAFSPYLWIGTGLSLFFMIGLVRLFQTQWRIAFLMLLFGIYYLVLIANARLMIVRNYLPLFPFLALIIAHGLNESVQKAWQSRRVLRPLLILLAIWPAMNGHWIHFASHTINRNVDPSIYLTQAVDFIQKDKNHTYYVSKIFNQRCLAHGIDIHALPNVVRSLDDKPNYAVIFFREFEDWRWMNNRRDLNRVVFGEQAVNFDYYSVWLGRNLDSRVHIINGKYATPMGVK